MKKHNSKIKNVSLRQQADMLLNKKVKKSDSEFLSGGSNNLKLIHELEVHEIELEVQNEELKLAKEKAVNAKMKYSELYEFAPSCYLTLTKTGKINHLNYSAENLLEKDRSQLIKSSFGFFVSSDTRTVYNHFLKKIFKSKLKETCELKLVTGDSLIKEVLVNGIISKNAGKCLVTLIDITEQKKTEKELIKAKEKAEESERLKSAFLANMSHEIRTPMNGILGFTELLKNLDLSGEQQQQYISIIEKSGTRLLNIINNIICISKIESEQITTTLNNANINELMEFIHNFFKPETNRKNLHFSNNNALPDKKAMIITDSEKVYAILTNLVKNAIKFTQSGYIETGYTVKNGFIEFYVGDSGPGIPEEQHEYIFERFRQGSETLTRNYEGAGLGLSISKAYVEMLGGKIWIKNRATEPSLNGDEKKTGSVIYFTIPAIFSYKAVKSVPVNFGSNKTKSISKKLKILIVEDDLNSEILIKKNVETFAKEILHVSDGVEAVEICKKNDDIDLVFMDINIPGINGYEATRRIRKFNRDVIIIAQTAYALNGDREKAIDAGCNSYISKPVSLLKLKKLINSHFD